MKEIIEDAKKRAPNVMVKDLIHEFEEFAAAMKQLPEVNGNDPKEHKAFMEKMHSSHTRLMNYFIRVSASYGMSLDEFTQFIGNENNFAPSDWEEIQNTKKQILEQFNIPNVSASSNKKKKNRNQRV